MDYRGRRRTRRIWRSVVFDGFSPLQETDMLVSDNEVAADAAMKLGGNTVKIRPKDAFRPCFFTQKN